MISASAKHDGLYVIQHLYSLFIYNCEVIDLYNVTHNNTTFLSVVLCMCTVVQLSMLPPPHMIVAYRTINSVHAKNNAGRRPAYGMVILYYLNSL